MRGLKPVSEHRMRSAMAFLGLVRLRDAVATRIGCMLRERGAKNCRPRGPIRHVPMAYRRSMIARCSACRLLSYPRLCGRVRWTLASQFASAHSAPHNMDRVVDVPPLCRSNCSMCIARFGKLDPTLRKQAKRTSINTVPFRTIVVESLCSGRCSLAYADGWSLCDRSPEAEFLSPHFSLGSWEAEFNSSMSECLASPS